MDRVLAATLAAIALGLAAPGAAGARTCAAALEPTNENVAAVQAAVLCEVNRVREARGRVPFRAQRQLTRSATRHSRDMVARRYFSHTSADGRRMTDRIAATGYLRWRGPWSVGENIAWGSGSLATPASVVQAWMDSPGHRTIVLSPRYRDAGVGVAIGTPTRNQGATVTLNVGRRAGAATARKRR